jgi:glycosyltransferase involved in cell wall biosynthesis
VIEVHNKPDVAMWLARWFRSRPVVLFLHNDPRQMRGARSARARQALVRRLARVVTVSEFLRGALLQGVPCVPPEWAPMVLHNALNLAALPPLLRPADREKLILFVGRIVADKAADVFVSACAQALPVLPGWRAEMIGSDGFSGDCDDTPFISKLRPLAVGAGVIMSGYQPHEAVMRAMARAAIVIVPSRWEEPFGMTALEAMACGCALMCSGRGGLAEVMGEAAVRIDPDRPEAVAQLLIALANDAGHRSALSEAGRRRAAEYFNASQAVAKVDAMRDEVLTRAGVGGPR